MRSDELLILNYGNFSGRTAALYQQLNKSEAARQLFIQDPTGVMAKSVFTEYNLTTGEINQGNRLLFSLLSNPKFWEWAKGYEERLKKDVEEISSSHGPDDAVRLLLTKLDRTKLYQDLTKALLYFADPEGIFSLIVKDPAGRVRRPADVDITIDGFPPGINPLGCELADVAVDTEVFVYAVAAVAVFVVAVAAVAAGAVVPTSVKGSLSRDDLMRVSSFVSDQLTARAKDVRASGKLTTLEGASKGARL